MDESNLSTGNLISTADASQLTGYAKDYVGQLCRLKKIRGRLFGKRWFVDKGSLLQFVEFSKADIHAFQAALKAPTPSPAVEIPKTGQGALVSSLKSEKRTDQIQATPIRTVAPEEVVIPEQAVAQDETRVPLSAEKTEEGNGGKAETPAASEEFRPTLQKTKKTLTKNQREARAPISFPFTSEIFSKIGTLVLSATLVFGVFFLSTTRYPRALSQNLTEAFQGLETSVVSGAGFVKAALAPKTLFANLSRSAEAGLVVVSKTVGSFTATSLDIIDHPTIFLSETATRFGSFALSLASGISRSVSLAFDSLASRSSTIASIIQEQPASVWSAFTTGLTDSLESVALSVHDGVNGAVHTVATTLSSTVKSIAAVFTPSPAPTEAPLPAIASSTPALADTGPIFPTPPETDISGPANAVPRTPSTPSVPFPIVEKIVERVMVGDVTRAEVEDKLEKLNNALSAKIYAVSAQGAVTAAAGQANTTYINNVYQNVASPAFNIDSLTNVSLQNPTVTTGTFATPTITGGTINNVSITGSSAFSGTTGTFSGDVTVGGTLSTAGAFVTYGESKATNFTATSTTATTTLSGGLAVQTDKFIVESRSGNVGLGTTSPAARLAIAGASNATNPLFLISTSTSAATSTALLITSTGRVGIGTTTPSAAQLSVAGDIYSTGTVTAPTFNSLSSVTAPYFQATSATATSTFAGDVAFDTNTLYVDSISNRLGVGTTTPYSSFSLWGSGTGTNRLFEITNSASTTLASFLENGTAYFLGNIGVASSSPSSTLSVNGTGYFSGTGFFGGTLTATSSVYLATAGGNVGIGTTSPSKLLSVHGDALISGNLSVAGITATSTTITFSGLGQNMLASINGSGNLVATSTPTAAYYLATSSIASIFPYATTTSISSSQGAWFATSGGNVGIGTTTPSAKFAFTGDNTNATRAFVIADSGNTERVTIFNNGNVGLGSTTPTQLLSVNGSGYFITGLGVGKATTTTGALDILGNAVFGGFVAASTFNATSTTATSTFSGYLSTTAFANTAMTAGSIPFFGAGGYMNQSNGNLYYDAVNNRLGLGSTTPAKTLSVQGDALISGNLSTGGLIATSTSITFSGLGKHMLITTDASGNLLASSTPTAANFLATSSIASIFPYASTTAITSSGSAYFATTAGNVGIGTTTPSNLLSVQGNSYVSGTSFFGGAITATSTLAVTGNITGANGISASIPYASTTAISSTGGAWFATSGGNVGVGTTSPTNTLGVQGTGYFSGSLFVGGPITATSSLTLSEAARTSGNTAFLLATGAADTGLSEGLEAPDIQFNLARTKTHANTTIATQRDVLVNAATHAMTNWGAGLITDLATLGITGAPLLGQNATSTNSHTLLLGISALNASTTNSYGLTVNANTGATNNYAAAFLGGNVGIGTTSPSKLLSVHGDALISGTLSTAGLIATSSTITFSGLGQNMLASINGSGNLVATSTPTAAYYLATSSIASIFPYASTTAITASGSASTTALTVSNLTATRIPFLTTAGLFTDDSDLTFTSGNLLTATYASTTAISSTGGAWFATSGGSVGVGTSSPWGLLSVEQGSTGPVFVVSDQGTSTPHLLVSGTGNVGIGTTSPYTALAVRSSQANGASATLAAFDTASSWTNSNARLLSLRNNGEEKLTVGTLGGIYIGSTTPGSFGSLANGTSLAAIRDATSGDPDYNAVYLETNTAGAYPKSTVELSTESAGTSLTMTGYYNSLTATRSQIALSVLSDTATPSASIALNLGGTTYTELRPGAASAVQAYLFNTSVALTTQNLVTFQDNGTTRFNIGPTGTGYFQQNLGIGTTSPDARLTVAATSTASTVPLFALQTPTTAGLATTSVFLVTANGLTGIGTTSPSKLLSVHGDALISGTLSTAGLIATSTTITFSGLGQNMLASINNSGNLVATSTPTAAYYLATSSIASIFPYASTTALSASGSAYFATSGGNVGIGTTTPSAKFAFTGDNTNATRAFVIADSGNTERVTIFNNGNVGLGSTTPTQLLSVNGSGYFITGLGVGKATTTTGALDILGNAVFGGFVAASTFNATSTTATSTFSGYLSTTAFANTAMTAGSIPFFGAGGYMNQSNGNLYYDAVNNRLGLGSTTPAKTLSVQGDALISGNLSVAGITATSTTITFSGLGQNMLASINGSGNLVATSTPTAAYYLATSSIASIFPYATTTSISSSQGAWFATSGGNVGIGTTTPSNLLSVQGNSYVSGTSFFGGAITATSTLAVTGNITGANGISASIPYASTTAISSTGGAWFATSGGNVGVGTTTPSNLLSVQGSGYISSSFFVGGAITATSSLTLSEAARTSGNTAFLLATGAADTGLSEGLEAPDIQFNLARTKTHANGTITTQRDVLVNAATHAMTNWGAGLITDLATLGITGAPLLGQNATSTNSHTLLLGISALNASTTNSYGLTVNANTGATNNYAAAFLGGNIGIGTTSPGALLSVQGSQSSTGLVELGRFSSYNHVSDGGVLRIYGRTDTGDSSGRRVELVAQDTAGTARHLVLQPSAGNVGIGTTGPQGKLHIVGSGNNAVDVLRIGNDAGIANPFVIVNTGHVSNDYLATSNSGYANYVMSLGTKGANPYYSLITAGQTVLASITGNVGIGTTSPSAKFAITGTGATTGRLLSFADSSNVEKVTVLDNGNVGIGVAVPTSYLHIGGTTPALDSRGIAYIQSTDSFAADKGGVLMFGGNTTASSDSAYGGIGARKENGNSGDFKGYLQFLVSSASANVERMRIDSSGNVGIGTTTPLGNLNVNGAYNTSYGNIRVSSTDNEAAGISFFDVNKASPNTNARNWQIATNYSAYGALEFLRSTSNSGDPTTSAVSIDKSGNVGIGTAVPSASLHIQSTTDEKIRLTDTEGTLGLSLGFDDNSNTNSYIYNRYSGNAASAMKFGFGSSYASGQVMTLLQSGNVGIGTTTPDVPLVVMTDSSANGIAVSRNNNTVGNSNIALSGKMTNANGSFVSYGQFRTGIVDNTAGSEGGFIALHTVKAGTMTEQMRIDNNGNVGIGTTSPGQALDILGDFVRMKSANGGGGYQIFSGASNSNSRNWEIGSDSAMGYGGLAIFQSTTKGGEPHNATVRLGIDVNGNVGVGTTSPFATLAVEQGSTNPVFVVGDQGTSTPSFIVTGDGSVGIGNSGLYYDAVNGTTTIQNLALGAMSFDTDAGIVSWVDLPISAAAAGTVESYSAMIAASSTLTIYGESNGSSGVQNQRVGVATTSPWRSLSVSGSVGFSNLLSTNATTTSSSNLCIDSTTYEVTRSTVFVGCLGSSERFKHDISPLTVDAVSIIKGLRPVSFIYNEDPTNTVTWGFTAEQAKEVDSHLAASDSGGNAYNIVDRSVMAAIVAAQQRLLWAIDIGVAPTTTPSLYITASSTVAIGTTTPDTSYALYVNGDAAATSFVNISTREQKKDIEYLGEDDKRNITDRIRNIKVAEYRYNGEQGTAPLRLGLIAEEAPPEVLSANKKGVDVYKLATFILAGVQELEKRMTNAELRITKLEDLMKSSAADGTSFSKGGITDYLASLGAKIENGIAYFKNIIVESLTVGSTSNAAGITLYDEVTKTPYCLTIANGQPKSTAGACGSASSSTPDVSPTASSTSGVSPSADTVPPVITVTGANPAEITKGSVYIDLGATVEDDVNHNLGVTATGADTINTSIVSTYTIVYTATDQAGNSATSTRSVIITDPNAPVVAPADTITSTSTPSTDTGTPAPAPAPSSDETASSTPDTTATSTSPL